MERNKHPLRADPLSAISRDRRGCPMWRESERGRPGQNQGEDRSDYWRVSKDIEVKIGGCEGETGVRYDRKREGKERQIREK